MKPNHINIRIGIANDRTQATQFYEINVSASDFEMFKLVTGIKVLAEQAEGK